jgi:glycosyltransferase involved in cell wall biosynthesis
LTKPRWFILFSSHVLSKPSIDIVLPCFNPLEDWVDTVIARVGEIQSRLPNYDFHCIIVNDGSTLNVDDKDVARLRSSLPHFQWVSYAENRGKGYALRQGVAQTRSEVILYTDIDLPYKMDSMLACLTQVIEGSADLCVAVRNESYYKRLPPRRRYLSKTLRGLNRALLGLKTSDTQGGLKVFNRKARSHFMATTIDRYLFDLEFVYLCSRDKDVVVLPVKSDMRDTIEISKMPLSVLRKEGMNFLKLITVGRHRRKDT